MKKALIIGTGGIGKRHIRGFLKTGRVRLSVCEPHEERRREALEAYDIETAYGDLAEANLSDFDMAVVCTPAHLHVPMAQSLADAGVPFLLEKPLSISMDGVDRLMKTVEDKGLTVRVGYIRRATPWFVRLRQDILGGRIGRLRMACINTSHDYRKYRPDYATNYFGKPDQGGGVILDMATHQFDLLQWIMGPVTEVAAMYDRLEVEGIDTDDSAMISLRFADGSMAQVICNLFQKPYAGLSDWAGTEGNLRMQSAKARLEFTADDSGEWEAEEFIKPGQSPMEVHESNFAIQAGMFLDALEGQPDEMATLEDARRALAVALAARESYEEKRIVLTPPR